MTKAEIVSRIAQQTGIEKEVVMTVVPILAIIRQAHNIYFIFFITTIP